MPLPRLLQTTGFPLVPRNLSVQPKIAYDPIMLPCSQSARILIAEDDESLRGLLVRYLSSLGHTAEALPDGAAAVERLRQSAFDVVITDMIMPGADGLAVMRAAKIADPYSEVIFLTGMPDLAS
ncbi:MAG: response regulator, partial [bacterium]